VLIRDFVMTNNIYTGRFTEYAHAFFFFSKLKSSDLQNLKKLPSDEFFLDSIYRQNIVKKVIYYKIYTLKKEVVI